MRVPLIANREMSYATRRLMADDRFDASRNDARILVGLKRARLAEEEDAEAAAAAELAALRAEYQTKVGKRAFNGWDASTLREKIAAA